MNKNNVTIKPTSVGERRAGRKLAYEKGRRDIMAAAKLDEVSKIKDQSEQLRKYAVQRHDADMEAWASAVALRAHYRIGQISLKLEKKRSRDTKGRLLSTGGEQDKATQLKSAGISLTSAVRAETLTRIISATEVDRLCNGRSTTAKRCSRPIRSICKIATTS